MKSNKTVKEHFQEIVDSSQEERTVYLDEQCTNPNHRAQVKSLLDAYDASTKLMDRPAKEQLQDIDIDPSVIPLPRQIGDFRLIREIGRGGMAVAYLAEEVSLKRNVALKILPHACSSSERTVARFRHEARAIAHLNHPNIVPIYSIGEHDGLHYIAMEYIEGSSLSDKLSKTKDVIDQTDRATRTKVTYLHEISILIAQIADAMEHAHQLGVIHRDIKPANILIDTDSKPRLADFGIAKNLSEESLTEPGDIAGTCRYMSPEQANAATTNIDHRTDIFSLGVVLYEAISLHLPFDGETPQEILGEVITKRPRRVNLYNPAISKDLETICHKAIEKNPRDRYQTAAHFAADLRCYVKGNPILARPPSLARRARQVLRSRRQIISLIVAIPVVAVATSIGYMKLADDRPTLSINGDPRAIAQIHPINIALDSIEPSIKQAPLRNWQQERIDTGYYRLVAQIPGEGFCEATRYLAPGQDTVIDVKIRSTIEVTEQGRFGEMVLIASGEETIAHLPRPLTDYQQRVLKLPAFWIDKTEVSNKQYQIFLDDTGWSPPDFWGDVYPPNKQGEKYPDNAWDNLPVVGITFHDAQKYAEWSGKRLPTALEWERAARGTAGRLFPWGDEEQIDEHSGNVYKIQPEGLEGTIWQEAQPDPLRESWTYEAMREFYGKHAYPVGDLRGTLDRTSNGILHLFGNVMEWTETIPTENIGLDSKIFDHQRIVSSRPWGISKQEEPNLTWVAHGYISKTRIARGFRCAKSTEPSKAP